MTAETVEAPVVDVDLTLEAEDEQACEATNHDGVPICSNAATGWVVHEPCGCRWAYCQKHGEAAMAVGLPTYFTEIRCLGCSALGTGQHWEPLR